MILESAQLLCTAHHVLDGDDITYSRISLVSAIKALTPEQEDSLAYILSNDVLMSKLAGF